MKKTKLLFLIFTFSFADVKKEIIKFYKKEYPTLHIQKIISQPSFPKRYKKIKLLLNPKMPYGNVLIDGKYYYIKLKATLPVFKTLKIIKQNSPILENVNVKKEEVQFRYFYSKPINKIPKNLIASKVISKNSILTISNTKIAPAILKGEKVRVKISSKNVVIFSNAKALKDGEIGEKIKIEMNRKIFDAKVINKGVVEIE